MGGCGSTAKHQTLLSSSLRNDPVIQAEERVVCQLCSHMFDVQRLTRKHAHKTPRAKNLTDKHSSR